MDARAKGILYVICTKGKYTVNGLLLTMSENKLMSLLHYTLGWDAKLPINLKA